MVSDASVVWALHPPQEQPAAGAPRTASLAFSALLRRVLGRSLSGVATRGAGWILCGSTLVRAMAGWVEPTRSALRFALRWVGTTARVGTPQTEPDRC